MDVRRVDAGWVAKAALLFLLLLAPGALATGAGALPGIAAGASAVAPTSMSQPQTAASSGGIADSTQTAASSGEGADSSEPAPPPDPALYRLPQNWQKGFVLWDRPSPYGSPESFQSLQQLKDDGGTSISPVITWYVAGPGDPHIHPGKETPTDDDLIAVIDEAHRQGLQVMLRFHVDCDDGSWRGYINPQDKQAFFNAYSTVLGFYAKLASDHAVEGIAVGAELSSLTKPEYTDYWRSVIAGVRQRFPGFLTYSAQWGSAPPDAKTDPFREYEQIEFWDDLDYLGISAYFELAGNGSPAPSRQQLLDRWSQWRTLRIEPFQARFDKPLIFTEVGYRSTASAAYHPWAAGSPGSVDLQIQAELYSALFESWADVPWFKGAYFWFWPTEPDGTGLERSDYPPTGKPAEEVVRRWYRLLDDMEQPPWKPHGSEGTIPPEE